MINKNKKRKEEMMKESIKEVLMKRDGMSAEEADNLIQAARDALSERLAEGDLPFDICQEWFGLEPDYIMELV